MQIKKTWLIPAAAAALIITGGTALACNAGFGGYGGQHGRPHGMHEGAFGSHRAGLRAAYRVSGLTGQQRAELDKVFDAAQDSTYEKMRSWRTDRRALRDALRSGADTATIEPLADKAGQHVAEMIVMRAETRAKVNAVLTPEQRTELKQMSRRGRHPGFDGRTAFDHSQTQPRAQGL
jgi:Spy/CpxP family protein refolding chaperone